MELLLILGVTIFSGTMCGKLFQKYKFPQVTGFIVLGVVLGQNVLKLWTTERIAAFDPLTHLSLGMIGFMIGSELKVDLFQKHGRSIYSILCFEVFGAFFLVTLMVGWVTQQWVLAILFGAVATATAPAATVDVLWENKSRGPLTSTLMAIVALDDILALLVYGFASAIAKSAFSVEHLAWHQMMFQPLIEISMSAVLGVASAYSLYVLTHFIKDRDRILPFSLGVLLLTIGLAVHFHYDLILSCMILGFTLKNISPTDTQDVFDSIKKITPPIYVVFFVLVGARLDVSILLQSSISILVVVYFLSRSAGKIVGSYVGGLIGRADQAVTRYLGFCLFSQAGVAIGMAISIAHGLSVFGEEGLSMGSTIVNVIVSTTFVVQIIGPMCVKLAIYRAHEAHRDLTEDDVIESHKVADVLDANVPTIKHNMNLDAIVDKVKESESNDFCVVDGSNRLLGYISIGMLRDVLLEREVGLTSLILAKDIAVPAYQVIAADAPLKKAIHILRRKDLDFLPVVVSEDRVEFVGLIHYKEVMSKVHRELLAKRGSVHTE